MEHKLCFCALALCASSFAFAAKPVMECHTNQQTDELHCIDIVSVIESDLVRYAGLYQGGPGGIHKTSFIVATNCKTGVTHLKDKNLVSFAGGYGAETPLLKKLREIMCSAVPKQLKN